jgi:PAS domain S-box-containing protein
MSKVYGIYKSILENSGDGIAVLYNGKIKMVNPKTSKISGYSHKELMSKPFADFISDKDRARVMSIYQKRLSDYNVPEMFNFALMHKSGRTVACECSIVKIEWRCKNTAMVIFRDISDKLEMVNALQEKNETLRRLMGEIEEEKRSTALQIQNNIDKVILPILYNLKQNIDPANNHYYLLLVNSLENITLPYVSQLEMQFSQLTTRELQLCTMIRNGLSSKQIASTLNKSPETIKKQRKIIRRKLGIGGEKVNMASFLNRLL